MVARSSCLEIPGPHQGSLFSRVDDVLPGREFILCGYCTRYLTWTYDGFGDGPRWLPLARAAVSRQAALDNQNVCWLQKQFTRLVGINPVVVSSGERIQQKVKHGRSNLNDFPASAIHAELHVRRRRGRRRGENATENGGIYTRMKMLCENGLSFITDGKATDKFGMRNSELHSRNVNKGMLKVRARTKECIDIRWGYVERRERRAAVSHRSKDIVARSKFEYPSAEEIIPSNRGKAIEYQMNKTIMGRRESTTRNTRASDAALAAERHEPHILWSNQGVWRSVFHRVCAKSTHHSMYPPPSLHSGGPLSRGISGGTPKIRSRFLLKWASPVRRANGAQSIIRHTYNLGDEVEVGTITVTIRPILKSFFIGPQPTPPISQPPGYQVGDADSVQQGFHVDPR
ncbi:hypothetical protein B0H17DRAFT_1288061 [Mycena rosella]|uniref:Uncharacterized protein n=1 Tax=Mycena rosella TaxID=1033263 RepID=A0AAD7DH75_MYCRO|nr:hypothetical protein B0H17DRAFT_1288061 [Mycena rosella]